MLSRRTLLTALLARQDSLPPVRAITRGPKFHWFGYYDKLQFDPSSRYVLGMQVDFEHRSLKADDVIRLGIIDTADGDRWREIGTSRAWNWQQGCMLQWLPRSRDEVIWNDRKDDGFISVIANVKTGKTRTLPAPIYAVSPDGKWAVSPDFVRLNDCRPGYGYAGFSDPYAGEPAPTESGILRMDLETQKAELLFPFSQIAAIPYQTRGEFDGAKHWFNHLLFSPNGARFIFLHRWRGPKHGRSFGTRMFTVGIDSSKPCIVDPYGKTSHFIWRDARHILAWAWHPSLGKEKFYLYTDQSSKVEPIGPDVMTVNGHCSYLPGKRWILNDTYPDRERLQHPYLYHVASGRKIALGHFHSPPEYKDEWRCDTHPRFSPDGRKVVIDSPHHGGRQMYLIDISRLDWR